MKNSRVLHCKQQVYDLRPIRIILLAIYYGKAFTPIVCKYYNAFQLRFFDMVKKLQAFYRKNQPVFKQRKKKEETQT